MLHDGRTHQPPVSPPEEKETSPSTTVTTLAISSASSSSPEVPYIEEDDMAILDAEQIALEILSPRPPPDDIAPEELAALVVAGPCTTRQTSTASSRAESMVGMQAIRKSTSSLATHHTLAAHSANDAESLVAALTKVSTATSEPSAVRSGTCTVSKPSSPMNWKRYLCCTSPRSANARDEPIGVWTSTVDRSNYANGSGSSSAPRKRFTFRFPVSLRYSHRRRQQQLGTGSAATHEHYCTRPCADASADHSGNGHLLGVCQGDVAAPLLPPLAQCDANKKCFIIDLDETLVHSSFMMVPNPDFKVRVNIDNKMHQVYVLKRPFVEEFLQHVGPLFECVLFTASLAKYADPVTDFIDPHRMFRHRLFRESCCFYNGNYVKDLSQLGRDVNQTVILDNSPVSYFFHQANAVHITSWFDNPEDRALLDLIPYFEALAAAPNVPDFLMAHAPPPGSTASHPPHYLLQHQLEANSGPTVLLSPEGVITPEEGYEESAAESSSATGDGAGMTMSPIYAASPGKSPPCVRMTGPADSPITQVVPECPVPVVG